MTNSTARNAVLHRRDHIVQILTDAGCTQPRLAGWAAANRPMPTGVPIEIWVTLSGPHDWNPSDLARLDEQLSDLIKQPVVVSHVPPTATNTLANATVITLAQPNHSIRTRS